VALINRVLLVK